VWALLFRRTSSAARRPLGLGALFLLGALAACEPQASHAAADPVRDYRGAVLAEPLAKPDFVLTDTDGAPYSFRERTAGKLALVFVGYTNCPDICPVHMANLAAVLKQKPEVAARTEVIFITADPTRDTPERLREWLDAFDPRFVGLRGTDEELRRVEAALGLPNSAAQPVPGEEYAVGHASQVVAFSPDGYARVVYPFGTRQADWVHDLPKLIADTSGAPAAAGQSGALSITRAHLAAPAGQGPAAMYLTIRNAIGAADTLDGVETDAAERTELHDQVHAGGRVEMHQVEALPLAAGETLALAPGGLHVMLLGVHTPLAAGDTVEARLRFRRAGEVTVRVPIVSYAELAQIYEEGGR
jgi:cytochrome oxidase Cu insertion factor (SCO1/SenC/PrrC family)/copper(I)-binding protein